MVREVCWAWIAWCCLTLAERAHGMSGEVKGFSIARGRERGQPGLLLHGACVLSDCLKASFWWTQNSSKIIRHEILSCESFYVTRLFLSNLMIRFSSSSICYVCVIILWQSAFSCFSQNGSSFLGFLSVSPALITCMCNAWIRLFQVEFNCLFSLV